MHEPIFRTLDNGMQLAFWPQPHLHSLGIGIYVKVGPRFEEPRLLGISHFLEHVLFRGNERYQTSLAMNRTFETWGGSINAYTTREFTYFHGKLHPDYLAEGIAFIKELVSTPLFKDIELERKIILEERLQDVDADGQMLEEDDLSREHLWKGHPLSHPIIGSSKTIRKIKQEDLKRHFETFYHASNFVLCVTGRFSPEEAIQYAQEAFADLPHKAPLQMPHDPPSPPEQHTAFVFNDSSQISLMLSFQAPEPKHPSFLSLLLVDKILDGGMSSRLWQRLVEGKGLCYDLWTSIDAYSDTSVFEIGSDTAPEKVIQLAQGFYEELRKLREHGVTEEECQLAKRRWLFSHEFALDRVEGLNERLGTQVLYQHYLPYQEQRKKVEQLQRDDLNQMIKQIIRPENHVLTAVGALTKRLKRELKELSHHLNE